MFNKKVVGILIIGSILVACNPTPPIDNIENPKAIDCAAVEAAAIIEQLSYPKGSIVAEQSSTLQFFVQQAVADGEAKDVAKLLPILHERLLEWVSLLKRGHGKEVDKLMSVCISRIPK